ncbi:MAG TPA: HEAT repeat domain-containing protein [Pirellulales bacterium]|nr:HEAT repeat domain-containing protein [Pirellulales bacterium]
MVRHRRTFASGVPRVLLAVAAVALAVEAIAEEPAGTSRPGRVRVAAVDAQRLRYEGKSFAQWQEQFLTELEPTSRLAALRALAKFGRHGYAEESAATIATALDDDHSELVDSALAELGGLGEAAVPYLVEALERSRREPKQVAVRRGCLAALGRIGPKAESGAPAIFETLVDLAAPAGESSPPSKDVELARDALLHLGKAAVPTLIAALSGGAPPSVEASLMLLQALGPVAAEAVPALIGILARDEAAPRRGAANALSAMREKAAPATEPLLGMLHDPNVEVRADAAAALWRIAPGSESVLAALGEAVREKSGLVARRLALAFEAPPAEAAERSAGSYGDAMSRSHGAETSLDRSVREHPHAAVALLLEVLRSPGFDCSRREGRELATSVMGIVQRLGPRAEAAVPALIELARHKLAHIRCGAIDALGAVGAAARDAVPVLTELVGDSQRPYTQRRTALRIQPVDPSDTVGRHAAAALARIQGDDAQDR